MTGRTAAGTVAAGATAAAAAVPDAEKIRRQNAEDVRMEIVRLAKYKHLRGRPATINSIKEAGQGIAASKTVQYLKKRGLVTWERGEGAPKLTVLGRSLVMAAELGITFLDACILAVIYRFARVMSTSIIYQKEGQDGSRQRIFIPKEAVREHMIDWPYGEAMFKKSLSRIRGAGIIPRSNNRVIVCDLQQLSGIHDKLVELDGWVEETSTEMRRLLITPRYRVGSKSYMVETG